MSATGLLISVHPVGLAHVCSISNTSDSYSEESYIKYHQGGFLVICLVLQFIQIFYLRLGLEHSELLSNHSPTATRADGSVEITSLTLRLLMSYIYIWSTYS